VDLTEADATTTEEVDLRVQRIVHLLAPFDNWELAVMDTYLEHPTPVRFDWEAVPEAATYDLHVQEVDHTHGSAVVRSWDWEQTRAPSYVAALPPSPTATHYQFRLWAHNERGDEVGLLMITYSTGMGWDYRFKAR
jgi:hypothetical protein